MIDQYKTISKAGEGLFKDRGSRFIGLIANVNTEEEVKTFLESVRIKYADARHHCYAYDLGPEPHIYRNSDDGEPSNSAGPPIYGQIQAYELTNVAIVVVRYFGGTKLGVGGLINAYKLAAKEAIDSSTIIEQKILNYYRIQYNYHQTALVERIVGQNESRITQQTFEAVCSGEVGITDNLKEGFITAMELNDIVVEFIARY